MQRVQLGLMGRVAALVCAVVAIVGAFWGVRHLQLKAAERHFETVWDTLESGQSSPLEVARASDDWSRAELRMPLPDVKQSLALHVRRLALLISQVEKAPAAGDDPASAAGDQSCADDKRSSSAGKRETLDRLRQEFYDPAISRLRAVGGVAYIAEIDKEFEKPNPQTRVFPQPR